MIENLESRHLLATAMDDSYSVHSGTTLTVDGDGTWSNDDYIAAYPYYDTFNELHYNHAAPGGGSYAEHGALSSIDSGDWWTDEDGTTGMYGFAFTYTPEPGFIGSDSFTYSLADWDGSEYLWSSATVTIDVTNSDPVANDSSATTDENVTLAGNVNVVDGDSDSLTMTVVSGTHDGSLALNDDGTFSYTPNSGFIGTDSFTFHASDSVATSADATVTIAVNAPPGAVDDSYSMSWNHTLVTGGGDGVLGNDSYADPSALTATATAGPTHGTLSLNGDGSFFYTPNTGYVGSDSFSYTASDGMLSSDATVTIDVINHAPIAGEDYFGTATGGEFDVGGAGVLGDDVELDDEPLTASLVTGPSHGTLMLNGDGTFSYTPDSEYHGDDSFEYSASDGLLSSTAVAHIHGNKAPELANDEYAVAHDGSLSVNASQGVLVNDRDPDGDSLSASLVSGPTHGSLSFNSDGSFTYAPEADYEGVDSFVYAASDGILSSVATAAITVGYPPAAVDDVYSVDANTTLTKNAAQGVLANDSDGDGDNLTAALVSGPAHGTLTFESDGSFTYIPNTESHGIDHFTYTASDPFGAYSTATVTIAVSNHKPVAGNFTFQDLDAPNYWVYIDRQYTVDVLAGASPLATDEDGDPITDVRIWSLADTNYARVALSGSTFTYSPQHVGVDPTVNLSFGYQVFDGYEWSDVGYIGASAILPHAYDDEFHVVKNHTLTVSDPISSIFANDVGDPGAEYGTTLKLTNYLGDLEGSLTIYLDGTFTYTPNQDFTGDVEITYWLGDVWKTGWAPLNGYAVFVIHVTAN